MALVLLLLAALAGCGTRRAGQDTLTPAVVAALLDRRAEAVLAHDEDGYLAVLDPEADTAVRAGERAGFRNLVRLPLKSWEYRVTGLDGRTATSSASFAATTSSATATVELRYRLDGYDSAPVTAVRSVSVRERAGHWYLTDDRPGPGAGGTRQLWEQGELTVVHGTHSLVLGIGQTRGKLTLLAAVADRAVPAVSAAWPGEWSHHVVVVMPGTLAGMAELLGSPADAYRGIAAVTTGEIGASDRTPADRVVVNPEAYAMLGDFGKQVVLTHETTHVATRTTTTARTPLWLSEGFADWSAYRTTDRPPAALAPELRAVVAKGAQPEQLPTDDEFRFGEGEGALAVAYEGGWLACRMIAERWGEAKLTEFYRVVGERGLSYGSEKVLGVSGAKLTEGWRGYVRRELAVG